MDNNHIELRKRIVEELNVLLNQKIETLTLVIASAKESRDSDSKSSVGDKYETSRAMMHIEIDKNQSQLNSIMRLKNEISRIDPMIEPEFIDFGSVVKTSQGNYFMAVAMGKIIVDSDIFYSISLASPLGQILKGKRSGDHFLFQGKEVHVN